MGYLKSVQNVLTGTTDVKSNFCYLNSCNENSSI